MLLSNLDYSLRNKVNGSFNLSTASPRPRRDNHHVESAVFSFSFVSLNADLNPSILPLRNLEAGICESILANTKSRLCGWRRKTHHAGKLAISCILAMAFRSSLVLNPPTVQCQFFYHRSKKQLSILPCKHHTEFCILSHHRSLKLTAEQSI